jgi:gluconokinase
MNKKIVVMGVSGCGKSVIAKKLAKHYMFPFFDGDDFHPQENVDKMGNGMALNDEDRGSWLFKLNHIINKNDSLVLSCSALTKAHRDQLKRGNDGVQFVYLKGSRDLIWSRLELRTGHYFTGEAMLESQLETLVEPGAGEAIAVDIDHSIEDIVNLSIALLDCRKYT